MRIAFCTTCKGRLKHLQKTLPENLINNPNSKFIVLCYGKDFELTEWLRTRLGGYIFKGQLAVYVYPAAKQFHMAHAKNMAHRCGLLEGCDVLVNLDADNYAPRGFEEYIRATMTPDRVLFGQVIKGVSPRGVNGRIVVNGKAFLKAGGYDEQFDTWGPDDKDFNARLACLGYELIEIEQRFLNAILHNDRVRFREYPHVRKNGYTDYVTPPTVRSCVVNGGRIGCGHVFRNFHWDDPFFLAPVPTRIFGVGMQKTATTSLHHAFEILGFESAHWRSAPWARAIWRDMNKLGFSPTLERSYALCDLPIPLLFRQLDRGYPGAKFILTIRDENDWLDSVRKHWDPAFNQFRAVWDTDAFSHRIHKICYGREDFSEKVFRRRYRKHNQEVIDYFAGRPEDLLVMDMSRGDGWRELCEFLKVPIPQVEYPRAYASY